MMPGGPPDDSFQSRFYPAQRRHERQHSPASSFDTRRPYPPTHLQQQDLLHRQEDGQQSSGSHGPRYLAPIEQSDDRNLALRSNPSPAALPAPSWSLSSAAAQRPESLLRPGGTTLSSPALPSGTSWDNQRTRAASSSSIQPQPGSAPVFARPYDSLYTSSGPDPRERNASTSRDTAPYSLAHHGSYRTTSRAESSSAPSYARQASPPASSNRSNVGSSTYYGSSAVAAGPVAAQPPGDGTSSHFGPRTEAAGSQARIPSLEGLANVVDGRKYKLEVVQSPSRARMCGFGDKDRRPLNPPLIVKLSIIDITAGEEVAANDVDTSSFFLASDLVHPEELDASPRNLLVHQHATTVASSSLQHRSPEDEGITAGARGGVDSGVQAVGLVGDPSGQRSPAQAGSQADALHDVGSSSSNLEQRGTRPTSSRSSAALDNPYTTLTTETFTRNFVGASVASANILKDETDRIGIFFVLQDLSVRTEGVYRIKLTLANLSGDDGQLKAHGGISEALAGAYTEPFTVYTPRRFPGVFEPTALSKKFAAQGVKIPVRVDRKKRRRDSSGGAAGGGGGGGGGADRGDDGEGDELDDD